MTEEELRIGVYVCHCGINIGSVIDVPGVVEYASKLDDVAISRENMFVCSAPGQNAIMDDIQNEKLNRIVVASCSPKMHENTFRKACEQAGLNPYLFEMANIREQASWVHPNDPIRATDKAKTLIRMAVAKARLLEPIEKETSSVKDNLLVIGGGVAGLKATIDAAERGMKVTLVERKPTLGGNAARIGDLVHSEKTGHQITVELIDRIKNNDKVTILTNSEVKDVKGAYGDYKVTILSKPRYIKNNIPNPEEGIEICPVQTTNEYEYGLNNRKAFFKPFKGAFPDEYVIDMDICPKCNRCVEVCGEEFIDLNENPTEITDEFGTIIVTIGYDPYTPKKGEFGFYEHPSIITLMQLERIMSDKTMDLGTVRVSDPKNIVFISCVGSMQDPSIEGANTYCSRMCCSSSFKNMIKLKDIYPNTNIFFLYRDIRTYARRDELLYEEASKRQIIYVRYKRSSPPLVTVNGGVEVQVYDQLIGEDIIIPTDLVVLANGMVPTRGYERVTELLKIPCSSDGWIQESHAKLRPVQLPSPGIYVGGTAQSPRDIIESVTSASAAASKALIPIIQGEVELEPMISIVDEDICGACGVCITTCPYDAISRIDLEEERRVARVDPRLCAGCGQCAAACPTGAMEQRGFKDIQLMSMINEVVVK